MNYAQITKWSQYKMIFEKVGLQRTSLEVKEDLKELQEHGFGRILSYQTRNIIVHQYYFVSDIFLLFELFPSLIWISNIGQNASFILLKLWKTTTIIDVIKEMWFCWSLYWNVCEFPPSLVASLLYSTVTSNFKLRSNTFQIDFMSLVDSFENDWKFGSSFDWK